MGLVDYNQPLQLVTKDGKNKEKQKKHGIPEQKAKAVSHPCCLSSPDNWQTTRSI
jgi:hypothetical protein